MLLQYPFAIKISNTQKSGFGQPVINSKIKFYGRLSNKIYGGQKAIALHIPSHNTHGARIRQYTTVDTTVLDVRGLCSLRLVVNTCG